MGKRAIQQQELDKLKIKLSRKIKDVDIIEELVNDKHVLIHPPIEKKVRARVAVKQDNEGKIVAISYKPGNITLHIKEIVLGAQGVLGSVQKITEDSWLNRMFALIAIAAFCNRILSVKITEEKVFVLLGLWELGTEDDQITVQKAYEYFAGKYGSRFKNEITEDDYVSIINYLMKIGCITEKNGRIFLEETISCNYRW